MTRLVTACRKNVISTRRLPTTILDLSMAQSSPPIVGSWNRTGHTPPLLLQLPTTFASSSMSYLVFFFLLFFFRISHPVAYAKTPATEQHHSCCRRLLDTMYSLTHSPVTTTGAKRHLWGVSNSARFGLSLQVCVDETLSLA